MGTEYMTPAEAGQLLGVTVRTIYQWITDGALPAAKIGGRWRIRRSDIDRLWEQKKDGTQA
jgi:excisionase family DNA binding protein